MPKFPNKMKERETVLRALDKDYCKMLAMKWVYERDVHILSTAHDSSIVNTKKDKHTNEFLQKP